MEDREIDLKLREVFRRNEPSFEQSQVDMVNQAASSRHVARGGSHSVLQLATITVAVLVVAIGVAAGVWQAFVHLGGNNPIVLITDQTTSTGLAIETSTSLSVGDTTTAPSPSPLVDGTQVQRAAQVIDLYFSYLTAGEAARFKTLLGPGLGTDAATQWKWERDYLRKAGAGGAAVKSEEPMVWAGEWYAPPTTAVPSDIDMWIRADPPNRVAFKVTTEDGTVRYFRMEYQTEADGWLLIPVDAMFGEADANNGALAVTTKESEALAERIVTALGAEFPALAGMVISADSIQDGPNQHVFAVDLRDHPDQPQWVLSIVLETNVRSQPIGGFTDASVNIAGSSSSLKNDLPSSAQLVSWLPNGTMVNVSEAQWNGKDGRVPLDIAGLKAVVELIARQFGTASF